MQASDLEPLRDYLPYLSHVGIVVVVNSLWMQLLVTSSAWSALRSPCLRSFPLRKVCKELSLLRWLRWPCVLALSASYLPSARTSLLSALFSELEGRIRGRIFGSRLVWTSMPALARNATSDMLSHGVCLVARTVQLIRHEPNWVLLLSLSWIAGRLCRRTPSSCTLRWEYWDRGWLHGKWWLSYSHRLLALKRIMGRRHYRLRRTSARLSRKESFL